MMLKPFLLILTCVFLLNTVKGQGEDTLISYFKYDLKGNAQVSAPGDADYFRVIFRSVHGDDLYNIKEFYKDGKIKFIGKTNPMMNGSFAPGLVSLTGDCIGYYPDGKKQSIAHYTNGEKEGNEYLYYPDGAIYCYIKNVIYRHSQPLYWECYDSKGTLICDGGNGEWINYDKEFKHIFIQGHIKNGYMEGEWQGQSQDADSIKYTFKFKKGVYLSGTGYDKTGVAYPFIKQAEWANYRGGPITFIEVFKSHLTLPRDTDGKKMSADNILISFIVEKDGHVTGFKTLGHVNPELNTALAGALAKCHDWTPSRVYGIPLRTEMTLPLDFIHEYTDKYYHKEVFFRTRILGL